MCNCHTDVEPENNPRAPALVVCPLQCSLSTNRCRRDSRVKTWLLPLRCLHSYEWFIPSPWLGMKNLISGQFLNEYGSQLGEEESSCYYYQLAPNSDVKPCKIESWAKLVSLEICLAKVICWDWILQIISIRTTPLPEHWVQNIKKEVTRL